MLLLQIDSELQHVGHCANAGVDEDRQSFVSTDEEVDLSSSDTSTLDSSTSDSDVSSGSDDDWDTSEDEAAETQLSEADEPESQLDEEEIDIQQNDSFFTGSLHTQQSFYLAVSLFATKHSLTHRATSDLLHLLSSVVPPGTKVIKSTQGLRKVVSGLAPKPVQVQYCANCQHQGMDGEECQVCGENKQTEFLVLRPLEQLEESLKSEFNCYIV